MEKKEKKTGLEQLLNSLIEKGWKPRGRKKTLHIGIYDCDLNVYLDGGFMNEDKKSFRDLVSMESGMRQFVCQNDMVDDGVEYEGYALVDVDGGAIAKHETGCRYLYSNIEPEFYIMESALKDESELEEFLLNSIKID